jgi:hypothetical protein
MAMKIKHGESIPSYTDLDHYQLGFNENNNHLYIRNGENTVIDLNNLKESGAGDRYNLRLQFSKSNIPVITGTFPFYHRDNASSTNGNVNSFFNTSNFIELKIGKYISFRFGVIKANNNANANVRRFNAIRISPGHNIKSLYMLENWYDDTGAPLPGTHHPCYIQYAAASAFQEGNWIRYNEDALSYWNELELYRIQFTDSNDLLEVQTNPFSFGLRDSTETINLNSSAFTDPFYFDCSVSYIKTASRGLLTVGMEAEIGL